MASLRHLGAALVMGAPAVGIVACRGILGIDPLPGPRAEEAGARSDAGHGAARDASRDGTVDRSTHDAAEAGVTAHFTVASGAGSPSGVNLNAIMGWGQDFLAVGDNGVYWTYTSGNLARHGNPGNDFNAVWGTAFDDAYAVGTNDGGGFVSHFDGSGWVVEFQAPVGLYGVWGTGPPDNGILAVGENGSLYGFHPNSTWQLVSQLPANSSIADAAASPMLWAVTGRNINDFAIASDQAQFFHWEPDAGGLAYYQPTIDPRTVFTAAWQSAASYTSVYFGSNFSGLWWFTTGTSAPPPDASILDPSSGYILAQIALDNAKGAEAFSIEGIWGTPDAVVAVGGAGRIYVYDVATLAVTRVESPSGTLQSFGGVWGTGLDNIWIVGENELILRGSLSLN